MSKPSRHRTNPSNSSNSSSEDANSSAEIKPQSTWSRMRRPSAASSTKRPQFNEANRSYSTMSATLNRSNKASDSPTGSYFPGHTHDMLRTSSDDSYLHILAARKQNQDSETSSISSFTCSLAQEFDSQKEWLDRNRPSPQAVEKKQCWLDTTFDKLSDMYRTKRNDRRADNNATIKLKPHFLDLSSIISPLPLIGRSVYEDRKTPQAEEDRQLGLDPNTPKPTQTQHFKTEYLNMRLPSPPLISPLNSTFALEPLGNASHHNHLQDASAARRNLKIAVNPIETRRRQKNEWTTDENQPGGLSIAIPRAPTWKSQLNTHYTQRNNGSVPPSPDTMPPPLPLPSPAHSQLSNLARPVLMSRAISQDTAARQVQQHSPVRPALGSRTSSSALRHMATFDPASSTGFSFAQPPPLLPSSRESFGSSTGSESQPPTPVSATYMRGGQTYVSPQRVHADGVEQKEYVREWDADIAQQQQLYLGSALGLVPGKMVRAHSDFPAMMSRSRSGSDSSKEALAMSPISNAHQTPRPSRNQQRPGFRREQTANASPSPSKRLLDSGPMQPITTTPRSSSLKDIQAELHATQSPIKESRPSLDSLDGTESSLAYTKPSPHLAQHSIPSSSHASPVRTTSKTAFPYQLERTDSHTTGLSITPTNSYHTDLTDTNVSKWSPNSPPELVATSIMNTRRGDQSRAEQWGANLLKLTRGAAA